jgi:hypothetical protein
MGRPRTRGVCTRESAFLPRVYVGASNNDILQSVNSGTSVLQSHPNGLPVEVSINSSVIMYTTLNQSIGNCLLSQVNGHARNYRHDGHSSITCIFWWMQLTDHANTDTSRRKHQHNQQTVLSKP